MGPCCGTFAKPKKVQREVEVLVQHESSFALLIAQIHIYLRELKQFMNGFQITMQTGIMQSSKPIHICIVDSVR